MSSNQQEPSAQNVQEGEISMIDILRFIKSAWKIITIFGVAGLGLSIINLVITPERYAATSQITMAKILTVNNISPLGVNIEEPATLIARMSSPSSFTPQVIAACGLQDKANAALALSKSIELTIPKAVTNMVVLKTFGSSPQAAEQCNLALFELIKATQTQIIDLYNANANEDIARLEKIRDRLAKADKSFSTMGAGYPLTQGWNGYLPDEIMALKYITISNQNRVTSLASPTYVGDTPIAPKKLLVLIAGLFSGFLLGLMVVLGRKMIVKVKGEVGGVW